MIMHSDEIIEFLYKWMNLYGIKYNGDIDIYANVYNSEKLWFNPALCKLKAFDDKADGNWIPIYVYNKDDDYKVIYVLDWTITKEWIDQHNDWLRTGIRNA